METGSRHPIFSLLGCFALCYGVAFIGAQGALLGVASWYMTLDKPRWNPPPWVFAPVWTVLYGCMGLALWLVWRKGRSDRMLACSVFCVQLLLNGIWPWTFFAAHLLFWSTVEILVLWIAIVVALVFFQRQSRAAAWLLVPYLVWVTFAATLNFTIWRRNPTGGGIVNVTASLARRGIPQVLTERVPSQIKRRH
jgi:benzodiazapine receptor